MALLSLSRNGRKKASWSTLLTLWFQMTRYVVDDQPFNPQLTIFDLALPNC